jgi:hypothetical protein
MVDVVLFAHPEPNAGPAVTNIVRINDVDEIVVTIDGMEWRYQGPTSSVTLRAKPGAKNEVVVDRHDATSRNLAGAAVIDNRNGWIFWFERGQCIRTDRWPMMAAARPEIEGGAARPARR